MRTIKNDSGSNTNKKEIEIENNTFSLEKELSQFSEPEITSDDLHEDFGEDIGNLDFLDDLLNDKKKEKTEKGTNETNAINNKYVYSLPRPSAGRIVGAVFTGLFFSAVLSLGVYGLYMNYIKYPAQMEIVDETTGTYCLTQWEKSIANLEDGEKGREDWYLHQEISYANDDKARLDFLHKVASTVDYEPDQVEAKNIYGNVMIDRNDNVVYMDSTVGTGE